MRLMTIQQYLQLSEEDKEAFDDAIRAEEAKEESLTYNFE